MAVLNGAVYEWTHHAPLLEKDLEEGEREGVLRVVREGPVCGRGDREGEAQRGVLSEKQWAVMDYTDQMTLGCKVEDAVFKRVKGHFSEKEVVELTATVACYNCVSRFLVALDVGEMNGKEIGGGSGGGRGEGEEGSGEKKVEGGS